MGTTTVTATASEGAGGMGAEQGDSQGGDRGSGGVHSHHLPAVSSLTCSVIFYEVLIRDPSLPGLGVTNN